MKSIKYIDEESKTVVFSLNFIRCKLLVVSRKMHDMIQLRRLCDSNVNVLILRACCLLNNYVIDSEVFHDDDIDIHQNASDKADVVFKNSLDDLSFENLKSLSIILR